MADQAMTHADVDAIEEAITNLEFANGDLEVSLRGVPDVTLLDIIDALQRLADEGPYDS